MKTKIDVRYLGDPAMEVRYMAWTDTYNTVIDSFVLAMDENGLVWEAVLERAKAAADFAHGELKFKSVGAVNVIIR